MVGTSKKCMTRFEVTVLFYSALRLGLYFTAIARSGICAADPDHHFNVPNYLAGGPYSAQFASPIYLQASFSFNVPSMHGSLVSRFVQKLG